MTADKWARVSGVHNYKVGFNNATYTDKKIVALPSMEPHMQDVQNELLAQRSPAIVWGQRLSSGNSGVSYSRG